MVDNLTVSQRSYCMSRVRSKDTSIERVVRSELFKRGYRFRKHVKTLPGRPDIVFAGKKLAVFIDGGFWHGYRFPQWEHKISKFWREKIQVTRKRDKRNFQKLKRSGWKVIRLWQHDIEKDLNECVERIIYALTCIK